jgi:signal transduction histidine kinase
MPSRPSRTWFSSLRFRLPALFLAGIVVAGVVSTAIAFRLLQNYSHSQSVSDLRRDARGLTELYATTAIKATDEGLSLIYARPLLEKATGDRLYYVGVPIIPGQQSGLRQLRHLSRTLERSKLDWQSVQAGKTVSFEFTPPGEHRTFLAVAHPLRLQGAIFGALIVAKPKQALRSTWLTLMKFFGVSLLGGLLVAGVLAWYLSRRITRPVLGLSRAADQVAGGNYDVAVPAMSGGDEIAHLAERFRGMAERLAEAEQLERKFLMSVSHELRTPLTGIRGHVEALREGIAHDPESQAASLEVIAAEADRLERLVGDVLDLAKLGAHRFTLLREEVDMARLLDRAYATFGEEARRRGIDYRCEISDASVIVTDGDRVLQIISNLLSNAFRWTPDGGSVGVSLARENGTVSVRVADSGPGIPADERERIFRPFWSRDGGGTGLGLAIARELAIALGGRIELVSEPGHGSSFELVLPATPVE